MQPHLFRIVYCSRNLIEDSGQQPDREIPAILEKARQNNSRHGVTGALLYNSGYFAQVLEGHKGSIEEIFETIQRDRRHGDVTVLECSAAESRDFPSWWMAYVHPASAADEAEARSALQQAMAEPGAAAGRVLDLLRSLVIGDD